MSKGIIMSPAFSHLGIIVCLEGSVVFYNIVCGVNKCISEDFGSTFRHPSFLSLEITGLVNRRVQTSICEQLVGTGEPVNITDFTKYHSAVYVTDTRNGHDDRIVVFHDVSHFSFNFIYLIIQ